MEPKKIKSVTASTYSPSVCHEIMGADTMILVFWIVSFKPDFSLLSFTLIKRLFSSSLFSAIRMLSSAYLRLLIFFLCNLDSSFWFIQHDISHNVLWNKYKYISYKCIYMYISRMNTYFIIYNKNIRKQNMKNTENVSSKFSLLDSTHLSCISVNMITENVMQEHRKSFKI